jgi:hypothetical protein
MTMMIATQQLTLDFEHASLTRSASAGVSSASLRVSITHPTLGDVYVASEPFIDKRGRLHSMLGDGPTRWVYPLGDGQLSPSESALARAQSEGTRADARTTQDGEAATAERGELMARPTTYGADTPGCYRTKSTATRIPVSTISTLTRMMVMMRKVRLPVEKSGIVLGGVRGAQAGSCSSAPSPCARQPRWSSGGLHCDPKAHHQPICREARDAEMKMALVALPDEDPATGPTYRFQYAIWRCGATPQEGS